MSNTLILFGEKLKKLRTEKGLTSEKLCEELNLKIGSYRNYERGDRFPNIDVVLQIADYYHVSLDYFFDRDPKLQIEMTDEDRAFEDEMFRLYKTNIPEMHRKMFIDALKVIKEKAES